MKKWPHPLADRFLGVHGVEQCTEHVDRALHFLADVGGQCTGRGKALQHRRVCHAGCAHHAGLTSGWSAGRARTRAGWHGRAWAAGHAGLGRCAHRRRRGACLGRGTRGRCRLATEEIHQRSGQAAQGALTLSRPPPRLLRRCGGCGRLGLLGRDVAGVRWHSGFLGILRLQGLLALCLGLRHGQQRQQLRIQRRELVGQDIAQRGIGDLARPCQHWYGFQAAAVGVADDGWSKGVVAVVTGEAEQLPDARFDVGELLTEQLFQLVGFG